MQALKHYIQTGGAISLNLVDGELTHRSLPPSPS